MVYDIRLGPNLDNDLKVGPLSISPPRPVFGANMLRCCKQIYEEAISTLYHGRVFHLSPVVGECPNPNQVSHGCESLYTLSDAARSRDEAVNILLFVPYLSITLGVACFKSLQGLPSLRVVSVGICFQRESGWIRAARIVPETLWLTPTLTGIMTKLLEEVPEHCSVELSYAEHSTVGRGAPFVVPYVVPREVLLAIHCKYASLQGLNHGSKGTKCNKGGHSHPNQCTPPCTVCNMDGRSIAITTVDSRACILVGERFRRHAA